MANKTFLLRLFPLGLAALLPLPVASVAYATTQLGWAGQFRITGVACENDACTGLLEWGLGVGTPYASHWDYVGQQGIDTAGRANAKEVVDFMFRDSSQSGCSSETVQLARYRTSSPPSVGSSCSVSATFVASASQTFDSCQFPASDTYTQHRLLPSLNFSAETAVGTTIGYRTVTTHTNQNGVFGSLVECYTIRWNN